MLPSTAHWLQLVKVFFVIILHFYAARASKITVLELGSKIQGTTVGETSLIKVDNYRGGQAAVEVVLSEEKLHELQKKDVMISITTCSPVTNFDTLLYAFSSNPLTEPEIHAKWIHRNDNDCGLQSTIEMRVSKVRSFFILVTGYRGTEGSYELRADEVLHEATSLPWGLDRIDQRFLPLDGTFSVNEAGQGTSVYILDSGVRASHSEFLERDGSSRVSFGDDFVERLDTVVDESGHGTHVAAVVAGQRFGVAKKAAIVSVRVLDRTNAGFISQLIEALEWTRNDILTKKAFPAVVVLSLSTPVSNVLNHAVARMTSAGISVITAAGNEAKNSCLVSPASETSALSVGAINAKDQISSMSNWGDCVGIYAPGEEILSAWHTGDRAEQKLSGTSSACPLVAGSALVLLGQNPSLLPDEIKEVIKATATSIRYDMTRHIGNSHDEPPLEQMSLKTLYVRSIPVILRDGSPSQGKMFLYAILGLNPPYGTLQTCLISTEFKKKVVNVLISTLGETYKNSIYMTLCCESQARAGCDEGKVFHGPRLVVRLSTREAQAYSLFETFLEFCRQKRFDAELRSELDMDIFVSAQPWVVDSRGYKYWAAPALTRTLSRGIKTSHLVLIICLVVVVIAFFGCALLIVFRRSRRKLQQRNQDYFDERAAEYEMGKLRHMDLGGPEDIMAPPQFLPDVRRFNSDLQGDALKTISPSRMLRTSFFGKSGTDEVVKDRDQEDRSRNQGIEKILPSTSFFTKLWTPRRSRISLAERSSGGMDPTKMFPRVQSFGPGQGAVVHSTPTLLEETSNTDQTRAEEGEHATDGGDAMH